MEDNEIIINDNNGTIQFHSNSNESINYLLESFQPFIDSYWLISSVLLCLLGNKMLNERILIERIQWYAEKLFSDHQMIYYESTSKDTIRNSLNVFRHLNIIDINEENSIELNENYQNNKQKLINKINQFRKISKNINCEQILTNIGLDGLNYVSRL